MNKQEFSLFAAALRTYFSKENLLPNEQAMNLWYRGLADIEYNTICAVLEKWVMLNKWSPSIAELREQCLAINTPDRKDWSEGWADVLKVINKYGYHRQKEAMSALDDVSAECVRRIGWENICLSDNVSVERATFRTIYGTIEARQHEDKLLSPTVKNVLSDIKLKSLTDGRESK